MTSQGNIFSDFLTQLEVSHTPKYSENLFANMTFKSLFGLSRLLSTYNIPNQAFKISNIKELLQVPVPYIAQRSSSFVIVTDNSTNNDSGRVSWINNGREFSSSTDDFLKGCNGIILQAYPNEKSAEPDFKRHRFLDLAEMAKKWVLWGAIAIAVVFAFFADISYLSPAFFMLALVDIAGIGITRLLALKSMKVKSKTADDFCGVLQEHGCDHVLEDKASSFFGIFNWSDVGIAYFIVSFATLLLFPQAIGSLTLINACCLPFTVWSIWYQRFKIHTWCTLCVITQCLLWCQFFCYLLGGYWKFVFPLNIDLIPLICIYIFVMLGVNYICNLVKNK